MLGFPASACPIWGTRSNNFQSDPYAMDVWSARAGGNYSLDVQSLHIIKDMPSSRKAKLTSWLVDERRSGVDRPAITVEIVEYAIARPSLRLSERIDRFFLYLSWLGYRPGTSVKMDQDEVWGEAAAWTECESRAELYALRNVMIHSRLIEGAIAEDIMLLPAGYERLESVEQFHVASRQAFVAMWFGDEMTEIYENGFAPAISASGFLPFRIDRKEHVNKIDDEIISEIRRSRFLIADFTCRVIETAKHGIIADSRGGVYYEAGFAQGLRIPVIWTVRADCISYVHFDIRQFSHILWNNADDLRTSLTNRIGAVIG